MDHGSLKDQIRRFRAQLKNPDRPLMGGKTLMSWIGALGVASSQKAFMDQALGDIKWSPRYPNQEPPKLNIAGFIMDFKSGRTQPKPNRFQDRPALVDEGNRGGIWGSLTFQVLGALDVAWGTYKSYAKKQQEGGVTMIRYDDATKDRMRDWLYTKDGRKRESQAGRTKNPRSDYEKHVRPLLRKQKRIWSQTVIARPFVGVTDQLQSDIEKAIKLYYEKVQRGGP
jgi:hypothetical protein